MVFSLNTGLLTSLCSIGCLVSVRSSSCLKRLLLNDGASFSSYSWLPILRFMLPSSSFLDGVRSLPYQTSSATHSIPAVHSNTMLAVLNARESFRKALYMANDSIGMLNTSVFQVRARVIPRFMSIDNTIIEP